MADWAGVWLSGRAQVLTGSGFKPQNHRETKPRGHKGRSPALTTGLPSGTAGLWSQNLFQKDSLRVRGKQQHLPRHLLIHVLARLRLT